MESKHELRKERGNGIINNYCGVNSFSASTDQIERLDILYITVRDNLASTFDNYLAVSSSHQISIEYFFSF
jgi:hypothetical protein